MPMFPTDTGNRYCDTDMKFLRSTGAENKKGEIKKSYVLRKKPWIQNLLPELHEKWLQLFSHVQKLTEKGNINGH